MNFLAELRRRNVIRMAGLYLVGAWLVVQVAATLLSVFEAPPWMMKALVSLLAIGFVVALVVAWVFELTPDGLKRDADVAPGQSIAPHTAQKMNRLIILGLALVIVFMGIERFWPKPAPQAATADSPANADPTSAATNASSSQSFPSIQSIAVLAFQINNSDADTEYLSDGLAASLIYRLAQLPNLKVSPSSSIFRYKGKDLDPIQVGAELGVRAVMSGRLVQRGDELSISVELLDVRNNTLLWGEQYNRKMSELLATQREIAIEITGKLQLKLSGAGEEKLTKKYTDNNEAYQSYLRGNYRFAKRTREDVLKGIDYFRTAIEVDPDFALAHAAIAESYLSMPSYSYLSPMEAYPRAKEAAMRALEIDPSLSEAHSALGTYFAIHEWNWAEAEREHRRAIELSPNGSVPHFRYGQFISMLGRSDEAIAETKRAFELEPLSLITGANLAGIYVFAGQQAMGLEQAKNTYDLEPNFIAGRFWLGVAYNANGMHAQAITLSEESLHKDPNNQLMLFVAGYAYAMVGRRREAEAVIQRFSEIQETQYVISSFVASIHAALGETDQAFVELERAFENRDFELTRLKIAPYWSSLRDDPRYLDLMKRIGFPLENTSP